MLGVKKAEARGPPKRRAKRKRRTEEEEDATFPLLAPVPCLALSRTALMGGRSDVIVLSTSKTIHRRKVCGIHTEEA
jgi:hypothetical protein